MSGLNNIADVEAQLKKAMAVQPQAFLIERLAAMQALKASKINSSDPKDLAIVANCDKSITFLQSIID